MKRDYIVGLNGEYFDYFMIDMVGRDAFSLSNTKRQQVLNASATLSKLSDDDERSRQSSIGAQLLDEYITIMDRIFDEVRPFFKYGHLIGFGRRGTILAPVERIDADLWDYLTFRRFSKNQIESKDGEIRFHAVRVYWHENVPAGDGIRPAPTERGEEPTSKGKGGRPATYRWDDIVDYLMLILGQDGLPETQKEMLGLVRRAARESGQREPDDRTIRDRFGSRFPRFFNKSKAIQ